MLTINLPLYVWTSKKKKFILNLNNYRRADWRVLSKAKNIYTDTVINMLNEQGLKGQTVEGPVALEYRYYHPTRRHVDVANPCSVIDKFVCDALTQYGIWPDDRASIIRQVAFVFGGVDKSRPRCELTINHLAVRCDCDS